jgi:hypothetical protein
MEGFRHGVPGCHLKSPLAPAPTGFAVRLSVWKNPRLLAASEANRMKILSVEETPAFEVEAQVAPDAWLANQELFIQRQQRLLERHKRLNKQLSDLRAEYKEEIEYLIGAEKMAKAKGQLADIVSRIATLPKKFPRTPAGEKAEADLRQRLKFEKHQFYHSLGFDVRRAVMVRQKYVARSNQILELAIEHDAELPAGAETTAPKPTNNPWTWIFPPYTNGWTNVVSSTGSAGSRLRTVTAVPGTGEIDLWSRQELFGADDSDWSLVDIMAEVGFHYRMPAAGLVETWIWYQDINTDYTGTLWDESGCSDASIQQLSRAYIWTAGSTERYATVVDYRRGENDGSWAVGGPTSAGQVLPAVHLFSNRSYAAGELVYISVGAEDNNYFWVDDMSCRSVMTTKWFVNHVAVRSSGAP